MKFLTASLFTLITFTSTALEETVEVGKYAHANVDAVSMIMSLLMVLALILASAWLLRKFNLTNKSVSGMRVIASLPLGHKEKLVVVELGKEQLLLGVSSGQINLIKTLEQPLNVSTPLDINQSLLQLFNKSKQKQEG
jgi:flagellar protein FliO/FliZ